MKDKNKIFTALFATGIFVASFFVMATPSFAQSTTPTRTTQNLDSLRQARCTRIETRVEQRKEFYNARKEFYSQRHDRIYSRVDELVNTLQNKGYNLDKIIADRSKLNQLRSEFKAINDRLRNSLNELRNIACSPTSTKADFDAKLAESKAILDELRLKSREINDYVKNTLIPNIRALRTEIQNSRN